MTAAQAIAHFEQQVAAIGHLPHRLPLVTYATPEDLSCGQEKATVADLLNQRAVIDALTEHARWAAEFSRQNIQAQATQPAPQNDEN